MAEPPPEAGDFTEVNGVLCAGKALPIGPDEIERADGTMVVCECGHRPTCDCHRQPPGLRGAPCGKGRHPFWEANGARKFKAETKRLLAEGQ